MRTPHRIYGTIFGLTPKEASGLTDLGPCCTSYDQDQALRLEFEGCFPMDIEDYLDQLLEQLPVHARGHLDLIDHEAWRLYRYSFTTDQKTRQDICLDDYLDKYRHFG